MGPGEAGFPDQAHPPGHHHHPRPPPGEAGFPDQAHPLAHQDHPALLGNEKIFLNTIKSFFRRVDVDDPWQSLKETVPLLCKTQLFESFFFK